MHIELETALLVDVSKHTLPVSDRTRAYLPPLKVEAVTGVVQAVSGKTVPEGSTHLLTDTGLEQPDKINAATDAQNVAGTAADFFIY